MTEPDQPAPDFEGARELAESLIRNAPTWDENEKRVDPHIHRLWVGYGVRVSEAYLALLEAARDPFLVILESHPEAGSIANGEMKRAADRFRAALAALPATESAQVEQPHA